MQVSHILAIALVLICAGLWIGIIRMRFERWREIDHEKELLLKDQERQREAMRKYRLEVEEYIRRQGEQSRNN